jgi:flagellar assembly factor FliW
MMNALSFLANPTAVPPPTFFGKFDVMTTQQSDPHQNAEALNSQTVEVQNNLGGFVFKRSEAIVFPYGMVGFANARNFGIVGLEDLVPGGGFHLLQCLDQTNLSFIVLPRGLENEFVAASDALDACILTLRRDRETATTSMSLNVRAPVLVNGAQRLGRQHVFTNPNYEVRLPLNLSPEPSSKEEMGGSHG